MPRFDSVVSSDSDHAALSQMDCLGFELFDLAAGPTAAKEEHDGRSPIRFFPARGIMDDQFEIRLRSVLVGDHFRVWLPLGLGGRENREEATKPQSLRRQGY